MSMSISNTFLILQVVKHAACTQTLSIAFYAHTAKRVDLHNTHVHNVHCVLKRVEMEILSNFIHDCTTYM